MMVLELHTKHPLDQQCWWQLVMVYVLILFSKRQKFRPLIFWNFPPWLILQNRCIQKQFKIKLHYILNFTGKITKSVMNILNTLFTGAKISYILSVFDKEIVYTTSGNPKKMHFHVFMF